MTEPIKKVEGWEKENWAFELPLKHITKIKALLAETRLATIEECLEVVMKEPSSNATVYGLVMAEKVIKSLKEQAN